MAFTMTRNMVFAFYAVLIVVMAALGYHMGKDKGKPELYAAAGASLAAVISALLWQFWAKKKYSVST